MRITERLTLTIALGYYINGIFFEQTPVSFSTLLLQVVLGATCFYYEGIRLTFYPLFIVIFTTSALSLWWSEGIPRTILDSLCLITTLLGVANIVLLGEADFSKLKLNGPYEVGFKEFRSETKGNEVSVFYPISKGLYRLFINYPGRNTDWLRHGDKTLLGIAKAGGGHAYGGKGKHVSLNAMRPLRKIKMDTLNDGSISKDFTSSDPALSKKLIPVIFCHGLSSNRGMHSGTCRDFASHGYIVFIMDHKDESSSYTQSENGPEGMYYNNDNILHD